jgi:hypothetical protein
MAGKAQQRDHCSRSNVAAASSTKMWQARKIFVGIAVGIACLHLANFVVESIRYECHSSPARGTSFDFCEFGAGFSSAARARDSELVGMRAQRLNRSFQDGGISAEL